MNTSLQKTLVAITLSALFSPAYSATNEAETTDTIEKIAVHGQRYEGYAEYAPTSGTKSDVDWLDVPQSVSVVTSTEIKDRGAERLVDALNGVAGVNNTLGEGSRDQFVIRGFDGLNDVYRDGMRDDASLQSYRSLVNVERIEIVKGAVGALYGRGSAGGLINLVSKRALGENFTRLSGKIGSNSTYIGQIDSSVQITEAVNARLNAEYREADSFTNTVNSQDFFIAPTLRLTPTENQTLDLDIEYGHQELVPYRGIPSLEGKPIDVPVSAFYGGSNDFQKSDDFRLSADYEINLSSELSWMNRVAWNRIELEQKGTRQTSAEIVLDTIAQTVNNFGYDPRTTSVLQSELIWATEANQLLFGADYNRIDIDLTLASDKTITSRTTDPAYVRETPNPGFNPFRKNTTETTGVYIQDVLTLGELSIIGNVRYDNMSLEQQKEGKEKEHLSDDKLSYRGGIVYRLSDEMSVYGTMARSWQLPYSGIYINPKLAEFFHTDLQEVGLKAYLLDSSLMFNAALFRIDQEQPVTNIDGDVVNKKEVRHQGIELEIRGQFTEDFNISAGYSYLDAEDKATGKKPNDVSDQLFSLWASYQVTESFRIGGGVKYVGDRYAGNDELVSLGNYTTVDVMAAYDIGAHHIQVNLTNIFDEKYIIGATGGKSGRNQLGFGAPAQFMTSYSYQF